LFTNPTPPNPKELKFVVIVQAQTATSDHRVTFPKSLPNGNLRLLGGLRGINRQYLPKDVTDYTETASEKYTVCNAQQFEKLHAKSEQYLSLLGNKDQIIANPTYTWLYLYSLNMIRNSDIWHACTAYVNSLVASSDTLVVQEITQCPFVRSDPRYLENPCCSVISEWEYPCLATPGNVSVAKVTNKN
jgi:hypothetical protein